MQRKRRSCVCVIAAAVSLQSLAVHANEQAPSAPTDLNVNTGETRVIDFGSGAALDLANLINEGTIYLVSSNPQATSGVLNTVSIVNSTSGLITSVLPTGGLAGFSNLVPNFSFTLAAQQNITNMGTISSAGNLTIAAGGSVINGVAGQTSSASMSAASALSMIAGSGTILNSGVMTSATSNINISALQNSLVFQNQFGNVIASLGSINFRDESFLVKENLALLGGNFSAREVNLFSGEGKAAVNVSSLAGVLNIYAGEAHVTTATDSLNLGNIVLSGDPTFFNTSGDIIINTDLRFSGQPLAIVARGDIVTSAGALTIDTSSTTGDGGDIALIAGASFIAENADLLDPFAGTKLVITGASGLGGKIDLGGGASISKFSSEGGTNSNGGDITLISYAGQSTGSGSINIPSSVPIESGGNGTGSNGNVRIYSAKASGTSIQIGDIDTTGGAGGGGDVQVLAQAPDFGPLGGVVENSVLDTSKLAVTPPLLKASSFVLGNITCEGCSVSIMSAGAVSVSSISADSSTGSGGAVNLNFSTVKSGSISANGASSGNGGDVSLSGHGSAHTLEIGFGANGSNFINGALSARSGATAGDGGTVTVNNEAGAIKLVSDSAFDVTTASGNGGTITLTGYSVELPEGTISVSGSGNDGNGGTFAITAEVVTHSTTGHLALLADGSGTGNGGKISIDVHETSGQRRGVRYLYARLERGYSFTIGDGIGQVKLSATGGSPGSRGGDGGTVLVYTGADLAIDGQAISVEPAGLNGNGGTIILKNSALDNDGEWQEGGVLSINGPLSARGAGDGDGGSITILTNDTLTVGSTLTGDGHIGKLDVRAGSASGSGGEVTVATVADGGADITIAEADAIKVDPVEGSGGSIELRASGILTLNGNVLNVDAKGKGDHDGGRISLAATSLTCKGGCGSGIQLSADATGAGNGGVIYVELAQNIAVGSGGNFELLSATGGSSSSAAGNGGKVTLSQNRSRGAFISAFDGSITIAPSALQIGPRGLNGNGGNLELRALNTLITDNLALGGVGFGGGGSFVVNRSIKTLGDKANPGGFTVGSKSVSNGVRGIIDLRAGNLGGQGGTLFINSAEIWFYDNSLFMGATNGPGGSITLAAISNGELDDIKLPNRSLDVSAYGSGNFNGGSIKLIGEPEYVPTSLKADAAGSGNGGTIDLNFFDSFNIGSGMHLSAAGGSPGSLEGDGGSVTIRGINVTISTLNVGPRGVNGDGGKVAIDGSPVLNPLNGKYINPNTQFSNGLDLSGKGTGKGGELTITTSNPFQIGGASKNGINGTLALNSDFGTGGRFILNGTETTIDPSLISVAGVNGGAMELNVGALTVTSGTLSADARFTSTGNGGTIQISASQILNPNGPVTISANGAGDGNGGIINLALSSGNHKFQKGGIELSATGGSIDSTAGSGGTLVIRGTQSSSGVNVLLDSAAINLNPLGRDGGGGSIDLTATRYYSWMPSSTVTLSGDVNLDGVGQGAGGNFKFTTDQAFYMGGTTAQNGIAGELTVNGGPNGAAGTVEINAPQIFLLSRVSAVGEDGALGSFKTSSSTLNLSGTGQLDTKVSAQNAVINLSNPNSILILESVTGTLTATATQIQIVKDGTVLAPNATFNTNKLVNEGLIAAPSGVLTFNANANLTLSGGGDIVASKIVFNSPGSATIGQNSLTGSIIDGVTGSLSITTGSKALSTSQILAMAGGNNILSTKTGAALANFNTAAIAPNASTVISTDTIKISIKELVSKASKTVGHQNQVVSCYVAADNSMAFSEEGTEVSEEEGELYLHSGKIVINATSKRREIRTVHGVVLIGKNSTAVVKVGKAGSLSAAALHGEAEIAFADQPGVKVPLSAGEVLVDAPQNSIDEDEMIAVEGIGPGEFIDAGIERRGRKTVKRTTSITEIVEKDIMINGSLVHIKGAKLKQQKAYIDSLQQEINASSAALKPIAYVQGAPTSSYPRPVGARLTSRVCHVKAPLQFIDGQNSFFAFDTANSIKFDFGTCDFSKGTIAYAKTDRRSGNVHIMNLNGTVKVNLPNKVIRSVVPGEEIIVSSDSSLTFEDKVGRRKVKQLHQSKDGKLSAHSTEFSIVSLLSTISDAAESVRSEKRLFEKVLKNCAAVQMAIKRVTEYKPLNRD